MQGWASWGKDMNKAWRDRVVGVDEPLTLAADVAHDTIDDAIEFAEAMVECTMGPLRDVLASLPDIFDGRRRRSFADWDG